jgi:hypothetical protein
VGVQIPPPTPPDLRIVDKRKAPGRKPLGPIFCHSPATLQPLASGVSSLPRSSQASPKTRSITEDWWALGKRPQRSQPGAPRRKSRPPAGRARYSPSADSRSQVFSRLVRPPAIEPSPFRSLGCKTSGHKTDSLPAGPRYAVEVHAGLPHQGRQSHRGLGHGGERRGCRSVPWTPSQTRMVTRRAGRGNQAPKHQLVERISSGILTPRLRAP